MGLFTLHNFRVPCWLDYLMSYLESKSRLPISEFSGYHCIWIITYSKILLNSWVFKYPIFLSGVMLCFLDCFFFFYLKTVKILKLYYVKVCFIKLCNIFIIKEEEKIFGSFFAQIFCQDPNLAECKNGMNV